ncbi:MAG: hypothetical protein ACYTEK_23370 [Planctomycetota bacterium]|jgi:hypothetical protein
MDHYMAIARGLVLLVTLVSIFTVLAVTVLKVIRQATFYRGRTAIWIAGSISVLFLVALFEFLVVPGQVSHGAVADSGTRMANHSLLGGLALGVAATVFLSQIIILASRMPSDNLPKPLAKESEPPIKPKSPGRPKKQKTVDRPSKAMTQTAGSPSGTQDEKAPANR